MRSLWVLAFVLIAAGCSGNVSSAAPSTVTATPWGIDVGPPAFRARSISLTGSTADSGTDYEAFAIDVRREFGLPVVLIPAPLSDGTDVEFTIRISVADFDRFFSVYAEAEGLPAVRVSAPAEGGCTAESRVVEIRGHSGCVGSTPRSATAILWTEDWPFAAEWSRTTDLDLDTEISVIVEWLNAWPGYGWR